MASDIPTHRRGQPIVLPFQLFPGRVALRMDVAVAMTVFSVLLVLVVAVLLGWLAQRAFRTAGGILKWAGTLLAGLLSVILAVVAVIAIVGLIRFTAKQPNPAVALQAASGQEQLARGERLAQMCADCHSSSGSLPLDGSRANLVEQFGTPPIGEWWAPNLTPGGPLKDWSDGQIVRAIREGVHASGRALLIMPAAGFHGLSDADVEGLVGYLRGQPAVQRSLPDAQPNLLALLFIGSGLLPTSVQPAISGPITAPPLAVTPEYGEYVVSIAGCRDCHGPLLNGHVQSGPTDTPSGPNLRAIAAHWAPDDLVTTIRSGVDPAGHQLSSAMPWQSFGAAFADDELRAVLVYVKSLGE